MLCQKICAVPFGITAMVSLPGASTDLPPQPFATNRTTATAAISRVLLTSVFRHDANMARFIAGLAFAGSATIPQLLRRVKLRRVVDTCIDDLKSEIDD